MSNELSPIRQLEQPGTIEKFVKMYCAVHKTNPDHAYQQLEVEKFSFSKELQEKNLQDCSAVSIAGVFLDVISNGLSFGTMMKHVYIISRNVKTNLKDQAGKDIYEKRLNYSTSPDGKIYLAQRAGSIDHITKPVIVYDGDFFEVESNATGEFINWKKCVPRKENAKIIAGFVYIVFKNGKREPFWMEKEDIDRLKTYSETNNSKWVNGKKERGAANALYTSANGGIDPGFFRAKLISHALTNIRKAGVNSQFEVEGDLADAVAAGHPEVVEKQLQQQTAEIAERSPDLVANDTPIEDDQIEDPNSPF